MRLVRKGIVAMFDIPKEKSEATAYPFWYIAQDGGAILRRPVMISHGIWFSREEAESHLRQKSHNYSKKAFVYCGSAHESSSGLRKIYDRMFINDVGPVHRLTKVEEEDLANYEYFRNQLVNILGLEAERDTVSFEDLRERILDLRREVDDF